jgi:hypothetical protein
MFNWLTAFIALALLAFAFQIPLEARRATEQALKGDVARARLRADTTMAMRKELDRCWRPIDCCSSASWRRPPAWR